jgi:hypothetical protein
MKSVRFQLGRLLSTPGALRALEKNNQGVLEFIQRHAKGDWGDVCEEDRKENELSLQYGFRLISVYSLNDGTKIWIISEANRSATTLLLPEEY